MAIWKGTAELTPGKADWDYQAAKTVVTLSYQGPYENCLTARPVHGTSINGFPPALKVTGVKVVELDGGAGRIDVIIEAAEDDTSFGFEPLGEPVYENEGAELQKALESHLRCGRLKPSRAKYKDGSEDAAGKQRTWEDWQELDDDDYDSSFSRRAGENVWTLAEYKGLKESGQDSYIVCAPVIRATTIHLSRPPGVGASLGQRQTPPAAANFSRLSDFQWLCTTDRCTKSKRTYTRTREWQGAEYLPSLVYRA